MGKLMVTALVLFSFFCFGFSGKMYTNDGLLYQTIKVTYQGNKLKITDWQTGNTYEFEYYGKGRGLYRGYDWNNGETIELDLEGNGKGVVRYRDTKRNGFRVDLGELKLW